MEKYKIDNKFFDSLNIGTLMNLLNEANSLLQETQDSIKSISDRSNELFKILIVATFALIGFVFTKPSSIVLIILSIYLIISFVFITVKLYSIIFPKVVGLIGTEPQNIINDTMIGKDITKTEKRFVFVMIQSKQRAINNNKILHDKLFLDYKSSIRLLIILIVIALVMFLVIHLAQFLFQYM